MTETTILDRLRARELGALTHAEREALERALAGDADLRALAADFSLVHALTAGDLLLEGASRTPFEALQERLAPARRPRRIAVAAAAGWLALAGAAFFAGWALRGHEAPLALTAIELRATSSQLARSVPADLPAQWTDFDPRGPRGVCFLSDLDDAERLARAASRPLLVYGSYPGCPLCAALDAQVFSDPAVIELAGRTVPVRVDLARLSEDEQRSFTSRGYPFLEMWRADGRTTHSLSRAPDPRRFEESLHDGLELSDAVGTQPSWEELRAIAARFAEARREEIEGRLADAERAFRALLADARTPSTIADPAAAGLARLGDEARARLLEARAVSAREPHEAERLLGRAIERFSGTSFAADLRAVLQRLLRDGRFPELVESAGSA